MAGKVDRSAGIAVRLTTPDDYYLGARKRLEDNVRLYRVVKGRRESWRARTSRSLRDSGTRSA